MDNNKGTKATWFIIIFAFIAMLALRAVEFSNKRVVAHDEAISYLAATCHQQTYAEAIQSDMVGAWVPASAWKALITPTAGYCFAQIGHDLAHYDIHPPLYFWALHVWGKQVGIHTWTGPALNTLIALLTGLALLGLARYIFKNLMAAGLVVFTWAFNPGVIFVSLEARQYDLLALWTVLLVWQVIHFSAPAYRPVWRDYLLLISFSALGLLTHYHFVLVMAGCVVYFILIQRFSNSTPQHLNNWRKGYKLIAMLACLAGGGLVFWLVHPQFYLSFLQETVRGESSFSVTETLIRLRSIQGAFASFFYVLILILLICIAGGVLFIKDRPTFKRYLRRIDRNGWSILFFLAWLSGTALALYMLQISPQHAMSAKYLSTTWLFLAFTPVFILQLLPQFQRVLTPFFFFIPLLLAVIRPVQYANATRLPVNPFAQASVSAAEPKRAVIDNLARGVFPTIFWHIPDEALVYAAEQDALANTPAPWLNQLQPGDVYISFISYHSTMEGLRANLALICEDYDLVMQPSEVGLVFELEEKDEESANVDNMCNRP